MRSLVVLCFLVAACCATTEFKLKTDGMEIFENDSPRVSPKMNARIANGQRAQNGNFPWHALLHVQQRNNQVTFCGGAIISRNWVLTSADCVQDAVRVRIDAGSVNFRQPFVTVFGDSYFIPRDYNPRDFVNNLALIRIPLQNSFNFTNAPNANVAAIRLPAQSQERETFENQEVYLTGFGFTSPSKFDMTYKYMIKWSFEN